ncbi:MAG: ATP-binding protein [Marinilabiliales bacterium]|nr:ATP-binding protein [Marinilabiliales bacterium]
MDIKMWKEDKWAFMEFSDRGIGIPEEQHRDVFKMFKRLPEAASLWGSGTGMGLYVVKGIIKAHGGNYQGERHRIRERAPPSASGCPLHAHDNQMAHPYHRR